MRVELGRVKDRPTEEQTGWLDCRAVGKSGACGEDARSRGPPHSSAPPAHPGPHLPTRQRRRWQRPSSAGAVGAGASQSTAAAAPGAGAGAGRLLGGGLLGHGHAEIEKSLY